MLLPANPLSQLGVICQLTECALGPSVSIIEGDTEWNWPWWGSRGTPLVTGNPWDKELTECPYLAPIPQRISPVLMARMLWGTISKALQKNCSLILD